MEPGSDLNSTPPTRPASMEMIEPTSTPNRSQEALWDNLLYMRLFPEKLEGNHQSLISRRDELELIQTYRTALQKREEQEEKMNRSSTQLKKQMRMETEWYKENVVAQWGHPMGIVPQRKIMTRSVTRSQPRVQSKAEQDEALKIWKRSMDRLRHDDTANRQSMEEEQARWAVEIATNLRDAKALSEAAEASGVDVVAETASLKLLIDKHDARSRGELDKGIVAIREICNRLR